MGTSSRDSAARVAAIAALALTACSGSSGTNDAMDKAGNPPGAVTLSLVTSESAGTPGVAIVDRFVAAVADAGRGRITIEVTDTYPPNYPPAWDQGAIRALQDGAFDMGLVPARAWHTEGVETLEPLQLPFLVQTDAQADRVAADPIARELLAGLSAIEMTGLGLYPEGIRHLIGLDGRDMATDGDLAGRTVRAALSDTTWATLEALGARPVDITSHEFESAVASGEVSTAESTLSLMPTVPATGRRMILANFALYTKFQVLAIRDDAWADLDDATQDIIHRAAEDALSATVSERPQEAEALAQACADGAGTVFASAADLDAIRHAVAPVVDRIAADPTVGPLVEQVRTIAGDPSAAELNGCPDTSGEAAAPAVIDPDDVRPAAGALPNGVYRFTLDEETIRAAYPNFPAGQFVFYVGVWTMELRDGHYTLEFAPDDPTVLEGGSNVYEVEGNIISLVVDGETVPYVVQNRWSLGADGSLVLEPLSGRVRGPGVGFTDEVLTLVPWERIE